MSAPRPLGEDKTNESVVEPKPSPLDAGTRLTATFELLEQVLLHVPMETVLFSQRVSQCFRSTIKNSRALQQKLFLAPVSAKHTNDMPQLNPLLTKISVASRLPLFLRSTGLSSFITYHGSNRESPLRTKAIWTNRDSDAGYLIRWQLQQSSRYAFGAKAPVVFGAGSWRDMCLTQPPCMALLEVVDQNQFALGIATVSTEYTMDKILDVLHGTAMTR